MTNASTEALNVYEEAAAEIESRWSQTKEEDV